jgi:hypothetical protein
MPAVGAVGVSFGGPLDVDGNILDPMSSFAGAGSCPNGKTLYVCSLGGKGGSFGNGSKPDYPLAAVGGTNGAFAKLANPTARTFKGDRIICLPGHVESISSADYMSDAGTASHIAIVGMGYGAARPQFNWTAAGSTWLLDTAGIELKNLYLNFCKTAATTVAAPITISAANCRIVNCFIQANALVDQLSTIGITTTAAGDDFEFAYNVVDGGDNAGLSTTFLRLVGADRANIHDNRICVASSSNAIGVIQCLTTAPLNINVSNNYVQNSKASSTGAITFMAGASGWCANNLCRVMGGTTIGSADNVINTLGAMQLFNNYATDADALLGIVTGTAAT